MSVSKRRAVERRGKGLSSLLVEAAKQIPVGYIVNRAIDALPIELHLPGGYNWCGAGTKVDRRLARGDKGINPLDDACKEHDLVYWKNSDTKTRSIADRALAEKAWQRVKSSDASFGERAAALAVSAAMKAKTAIGSGGRNNGRRRRRTTGSTKRRGGTYKRHARGRKKTSSGLRNLWTMSRSGKGLYLRPYRHVY